jgi:hypothetical protein
MFNSGWESLSATREREASQDDDEEMKRNAVRDEDDCPRCREPLRFCRCWDDDHPDGAERNTNPVYCT